MSARALSQKKSKLPPPTVITSAPQLAALLKALYDEPFVAVDTESNSLYVYQEQVCLIQISVPNKDYIVDSLAVPDLSPLAHFFADPSTCTNMNNAEPPRI